MAIPSTPDVAQAILRAIGAAPRHRMSISELYQLLAAEFRLSEGDLSECVPSGENRWHNRVRTALNGLKKQKLLEPLCITGRAAYELTEQGLLKFRSSQRTAAEMIAEMRQKRQLASAA